MDRLISEQKVLKVLDNLKANFTCYDSVTLDEVASHVKAIPSAEPRTGHWVEENINEWSRKVFCSECGCPSPFEHISNGDIYSASGYGVNNKTKFCPNCGCAMVEPQERSGEK